MNFRFSWLWLFSIIALLSGCSKPDELTNDQLGLKIISQSERRVQEDPYDIRNILRAYHSLQSADPSVPVCDIKPNNLYVRFAPRNESELDILKSDTTLALFDYPLNLETAEGESGPYESAPGNQPLFQYCVVPEGQPLPSIPYEVIYEVFIPPSTDYAARSLNDEMTGFYERLVNESARITGNLTAEDSSLKMVKSSGNRWTPKGRIRVWDDILNMYIPLNHVNVHARWFTHVETALTDEEGYFQMKSFSHKVNYSIKWENSLFTIRDGFLFQAWYNGPKKKGDWMLDIKSGKSKMFATIHRAAYRQFYGDNLGLFRPRLSAGSRTKISYMEGDGTGQFNGDFLRGSIVPEIQIWGNKASTESNIIFSTVSHELGHQLHSEYIGNLRYLRTSKIIRESWAELVEWAMTNDEYHRLGRKYGVMAALLYDHQSDKHNRWPLVIDKEYSPAFIDLVDSINQGALFGPDHPNDLISRYSVAYVNYNILMNATDIVSLREEISKHKIEGVDDFQINQLFLLY